MTMTHDIKREDLREKAEQIIDYGLTAGKPHGVTDMRVQFSYSENCKVTSENAEQGCVLKATILLYAGKRSLSFTPARADIDSIKQAIDQNFLSLGFVPENEYCGLIDKSFIYQGAHDDLEQYDETVLTHDEMKAYVQTMMDTAKKQPKFKQIRDAKLNHSVDRYYSLATNGAEILSKCSTFYGAIDAVAEDKKGMQIEHGGSVAYNYEDLKSPTELAIETVAEASAKLNAKIPKTASDVSVVLHPEAAEMFFGSAMNALSGDRVFEKSTFFKDKLNKRVLNSQITITDDPTIKRGLGSKNIDSTGMRSEPIVFIENGILKQFNVNLQSARKLGVSPIGRQSSRGGGSGLTNIIVSGGLETPEGLISDIENGIYVRDFNGGKANCNNGVFSREAYGQLIRNGEITKQAVSGFGVAGNLQEMFMNAQLANDIPNSRETSFAAPTTRINGLTISGS